MCLIAQTLVKARYVADMTFKLFANALATHRLLGCPTALAPTLKLFTMSVPDTCHDCHKVQAAMRSVRMHDVDSDECYHANPL